MGIRRGPNIVRDGLVFAVDAANPTSYPGSGTIWKDQTVNQNNGTLTNGPTFDSGNGGSIVFDGSNDYVDCGNIDDIKKLRSPIKKLMIEWVFDDKNKNILYKNDGDERYPDFKLYKMIARTVHNHTPQKVLKKEVFEKYQIARKKINNQSAIFNIDELPVMTQ